MNKYFQILSLLFLTTAILSKNVNAQSIPKIGDIWTGPADTRNLIDLPPPYGFENKIEFKYKDIKFSGAVKNNKIVAIFTTDVLFEIYKTKYINKPLSSFKNKDSVKLIPGWASYLPVEDGWYAGFAFNKVTDTLKVAFLFKVDKML